MARTTIPKDPPRSGRANGGPSAVNENCIGHCLHVYRVSGIPETHFLLGHFK